MSGPRADQFPFVENPATVLLMPVYMGETVSWWTHDGILVGGLKVNTVKEIPEGQAHASKVGYLPTPIPRSWGEKEFHLVVEYESQDPTAEFAFRIYYGCGDPSELHLGETSFKKGETDGKTRVKFPLSEKHILRNELFRATVEVVRKTPDPVLIYGCWLEVGLE